MVVVKRLPRYHRYLGELIAQGISRISSRALSEKMGVTASQIRQDFNCFGGFGQQGYGYNVPNLYAEIGEILGLGKSHSMIIIGVGNLGRALLNYANLEKRGFQVIGLFDNDVKKIGTEIKGIPVSDMKTLEEFCKANTVDIAALSLPRTEAEEVKIVSKRLIDAGVKGLWNFSYTNIEVPQGVAIENVHLSDSLMTLSYLLTQEN